MIRAVVLLVGTIALLACAADPPRRASRASAPATKVAQSSLEPALAGWCAEAGAIPGYPQFEAREALDGSAP